MIEVTKYQLGKVEEIYLSYRQSETAGNLKILESRKYYHDGDENLYYKLSYKGFDSQSNQIGTQVDWHCIKPDGKTLDCKGHFGGQQQANLYFSEMKELK